MEEQEAAATTSAASSAPNAAATAATAPTPESESSEDEAVTEITQDEAMKKIDEDVKEFFGVRSLDEAEIYFTNLPPVHHFRLVHMLASAAVEAKEADAQLLADLFARATSKKLCDVDALEEGLSMISEYLQDIALDAPMAYNLFVIIVKATSLDEERRTRLASKSTDSDKLLALLS